MNFPIRAIFILIEIEEEKDPKTVLKDEIMKWAGGNKVFKVDKIHQKPIGGHAKVFKISKQLEGSYKVPKMQHSKLNPEIVQSTFSSSIGGVPSNLTMPGLNRAIMPKPIKKRPVIHTTLLLKR